MNLQWIALPLLRHICQPLQKQLWLLKIENEFSLGSSGNNCNKPGGFVFFYGRNKSILECFKTGGFIRTWKAIVVRRAQGPENIEPRRVLIAGDGLRELSAPNEERILSSMTLGKCPACIISRFKHLTSSRKCAIYLANGCNWPIVRTRCAYVVVSLRPNADSRVQCWITGSSPSLNNSSFPNFAVSASMRCPKNR